MLHTIPIGSMSGIYANKLGVFVGKCYHLLWPDPPWDRKNSQAWPSAAQLALRSQQLREIMKLSALETKAPPQPPRPNQEPQRGWGWVGDGRGKC